MARLVSLYTGSPVAVLAGGGGIALLASGATAWSQSERWYGLLPTTLSLSSLALVFTPVIFGLLGAFLAGQQRRWGAAEWLAVSGASRRKLLRPALVSVLALAIVTHVAVVVAMVMASLYRGADASLLPWHLFLIVPAGCAYGAGWAALGVWLGRTMRQEIALPLAALAPYACYFVMMYFIEFSHHGGLVVIDHRSWLELVPTLPMLAGQLAFWLAVATTLSALALGASRFAKFSALGVSLSLAALILIGPELEELGVGDEEVCLGTVPEVCVPQSHEAVLEDYHAATRDTLERIPETLWPERVLSESSVHGEAEPGSVVAAPVGGNTGQSLQIDRQRYAVRLGEALLLQCLTLNGEEESEPWGEAESELLQWWQAWWRLELGLDPAEEHWPGSWVDRDGVAPQVERFRSEPAAVQEDWWESTAEAVADCDLEAIELP